MSEIEELREEIRKLREEITALRLSGAHVTHTHYHQQAPLMQPYVVPAYKPLPWTPFSPTYCGVVQGAAGYMTDPIAITYGPDN